MRRVLIAGGPRTGKTTLATRLGFEMGVTARHTDNLITTHDWSAGSLAVSGWMSEPGPWIVEGVSVPRALRKWLAEHWEGTPADEVFWLGAPMVPLTTAQRAMTRGCETVWAQVLSPLRDRGVAIKFGGFG